MTPFDLLSQSEQAFQKALEHLRTQYASLQIGRASAALVEEIKVEAYGTVQPLKSVASIVIPDARTIQIQCWDKSLMHDVEKALQIANLGINPVNDGVFIRLNIPPLTEERRKDLVKVVHRYSEDARIAVRTERQQILNKLDSMKKSKEISEDDFHGSSKKLQEKVDAVNKQIDEVAKKKEQELMNI